MTHACEYAEGGATDGVTLFQELTDPLHSDRLIDIVGDLFARLSPILQPISLDLILGSTEADAAHYENNIILPPNAVWHLCQEPPPQGIDLRVVFGDGGVVATAPVLDASTITTWLRKPLSQPVPGRLTTIEALTMRYGRARVHGGASTLIVNDYPSTYEVPVEHRVDGTWVSGRTHDILEPPITFAFYRNWTNLECHLKVFWTLWHTPGTEEFESFCECLAALSFSWTLQYHSRTNLKQGVELARQGVGAGQPIA